MRKKQKIIIKIILSSSTKKQTVQFLSLNFYTCINIYSMIFVLSVLKHEMYVTYMKFVRQKRQTICTSSRCKGFFPMIMNEHNHWKLLKTYSCGRFLCNSMLGILIYLFCALSDQLEKKNIKIDLHMRVSCSQRLNKKYEYIFLC